MNVKPIVSTLVILLYIVLVNGQVVTDRALPSDLKLMNLKGNVCILVENTYLIIPINDSSGYSLDETVWHDESEYWEFNKTGYLIEQGHRITREDSLFWIKQYSNNFPYSLERYFNENHRSNSYGDTLKYFEEYFEVNDTIHRNIYFSDSTLYRSTIILYDEIGRIKYRYQTFPKSTPIYFEYSDMGFVIQEKLPEFSQWNRTEYIYNNHDIIDKEIHYLDDKVVFTFEYQYTYDSEGNWVTCSIYHLNSPSEIKIRNIKYY